MLRSTSKIRGGWRDGDIGRTITPQQEMVIWTGKQLRRRICIPRTLSRRSRWDDAWQPSSPHGLARSLNGPGGQSTLRTLFRDIGRRNLFRCLQYLNPIRPALISEANLRRGCAMYNECASHTYDRYPVESVDDRYRQGFNA